MHHTTEYGNGFIQRNLAWQRERRRTSFSAALKFYYRNGAIYFHSQEVLQDTTMKLDQVLKRSSTVKFIFIFKAELL